MVVANAISRRLTRPTDIRPEGRRTDPMDTTARPELASPRRLVSISEVADVLNVDVRHVRRLVHERRIPYIKWGHLLRFDLVEIAAWIDSHRNHPVRW